MYGLCRIFLLTYMVTVAIPVSLAFNLDMTNHVHVFPGEQKAFFGYKVLQFKSGTNKGIIVTAPLNGSGEICRYDKSEKSKCFTPKDISLTDKTIPVKHFGLSIAEDSTFSQFTVCSPSVAHECYENSYLNSVCYKMTYDLQQTSSSSPNFQECKKQIVNLAFLFDGSGSMTEAEFNKNKEFIEDIMNSLSGSSIKFAAVQFSTDFKKVFDFNDYLAGTALDKLKKEPHMRGLTNTHRALQFVLEEIFENPEAGASPDATKVLVIITDGDPSDSDRHRIIKKYDEKDIIRFVIGVKDAALDKFRLIASEPKDKNAFKIENYDGLTGILGNFQKKIFKMEGSKVALAEDLKNELSQSGFSAIFHKDTLILGSVGSNSWRGSLQEIHGEKQTQIEDPLMTSASYMGYSVAVGEKNSAPLYFTGAPRFEHKGQVVLFKQDGKKWTAFQRENGTQVGSYFGAELCSVDINSDGNTDFLLVGAPMFYHPERREGQIYVYKLTDESKPLKSQLNIIAPSMGRFGTTIASLADLNGDGLRDVAVGAPLEDDNSGAVYIYLGDRNNGMRSTFSQTITGQRINPELRFFGQAIAGKIDLGEDGLPDIVIGSQGMAVVLRSRPVFNVTAHLSFEPKVISTEKIDCVGTTDENLPMVTLTACFEIKEVTKSQRGEMSSSLNISYMLDVDPTRQTTYRGFFSETDKKARNHTSNHNLLKYTCFNHSVYMPKCVKDTLSPISIKLNFSQVDSENASAILNMDSKWQAEVEVPFEKQCRTNDTCISELEVDFRFMTPTLLVAEGNYFNVSVTLSNQGDDSYNTSLSMYYPQGLSFSTMVLTQATRPMHPSCHDLADVYDKTICGVSLPVFRSKSAGTFKASFHISTEYEWNDTVSMTITGKSENMNTTMMGNSKTTSIPVQFEVKLVVTVREDTDAYLNFTPEDVAPKKLVTVYKIDNIGWKSFHVRVSLFFPTKLEHNFEMKNPQVFVEQNKTQCTSASVTNDTMPEYCSPEKHCQKIVCDNFLLYKESATEFRLSGDVQFINLKERETFLTYYTGDRAEVKFKSFIRVHYDKQQFVLDSYKQEVEAAKIALRNDNDPTKKSKEVRVEFIISPWKQCIIATGAVLGVLLMVIIAFIMFKMGCFKRKKPEEYEQRTEDVPQCDTPTKSDQSLEDNTLLEGNGLPTNIEVVQD